PDAQTLHVTSLEILSHPLIAIVPTDRAADDREHQAHENPHGRAEVPSGIRTDDASQPGNGFHSEIKLRWWPAERHDFLMNQTLTRVLRVLRVLCGSNWFAVLPLPTNVDRFPNALKAHHPPRPRIDRGVARRASRGASSNTRIRLWLQSRRRLQAHRLRRVDPLLPAAPR